MNAAALVGNRILLAVAGIVSVGIAARYLGLEAFGAFTTASAFVFLLGPLTELGLGAIGAREIAKRPDETQRIVSSVLTAALVLSLTTMAIGLAAMSIIYTGEEHDLTRRGIQLLLLVVPFAAISTAVGAYFVARQQAYMTVVASLAGSLTTVSLLVAASTLDWGFTGVVLAYAAGTGVAYSLTMAALSVGRVKLTLSFDFPLIRRLIRWALPLGGASVLNYLYWRMDIVLLSLLVPISDVALYGVAYKVVDVLIILPGYATITLLPELARLDRNPERLNHVMQKAFSVMQVGAVGLLLFFVGFSEEINVVVGGTDFGSAAHLLQILTLGVAVSYLTSIFGPAIVAFDHQDKLFLRGLAVLATNVVLCLLFIPLWATTGAAVAFVVSEIVGLALAILIYRKIGKVPRPQRAWGVLVAGAAMAVVVFSFQVFAGSVNPAAVLAIGGISALGVYVGTLYALRAMPEELHRALVLPVWNRLRPR